MDEAQGMNGLHLIGSIGQGAAQKGVDTALEQLAKVLEGSTGFVLVGIARHEEKNAFINMAGGMLEEADLHSALTHGLKFCKQLTDTPMVENSCDCPKCQARRQQTQTTH